MKFFCQEKSKDKSWVEDWPDFDLKGGFKGPPPSGDRLWEKICNFFPTFLILGFLRDYWELEAEI